MVRMVDIHTGLNELSSFILVCSVETILAYYLYLFISHPHIISFLNKFEIS